MPSCIHSQYVPLRLADGLGSLLLNIQIRFPLLSYLLKSPSFRHTCNTITAIHLPSTRHFILDTTPGNGTGFQTVFSMDGQYYSPQHHGLPLSYQYDESEDLSTQSSLRLFNFDNLPRPQLDHRFLTSSPSTSPLFSETYGITPQVPMSQPPQMWNSPIQCSPGFNSQHDSNKNREEYGFEPSGYSIVNEGDNIFARGTVNYGQTPRTTWEEYNPRLLQENVIPSFEPSDYVTEDIKPNLRNHEMNSVEMDYNMMETSHQNYLPHSMSRRPMQDDEYNNGPMMPNDFASADGLPFDKSSPFGMPSSSLSEDGNENHSREMTAMDTEEQGADEPYAKLIYRALMSAPNHSMVLQEIYQWFRDHTSKGSSDSKGWMNSIRHNLSMNAVCTIFPLPFPYMPSSTYNQNICFLRFQITSTNSKRG